MKEYFLHQPRYNYSQYDRLKAKQLNYTRSEWSTLEASEVHSKRVKYTRKEWSTLEASEVHSKRVKYLLD